MNWVWALFQKGNGSHLKSQLSQSQNWWISRRDLKLKTNLWLYFPSICTAEAPGGCIKPCRLLSNPAHEHSVSLEAVKHTRMGCPQALTPPVRDCLPTPAVEGEETPKTSGGQCSHSAGLRKEQMCVEGQCLHNTAALAQGLCVERNPSDSGTSLLCWSAWVPRKGCRGKWRFSGDLQGNGTPFTSSCLFADPNLWFLPEHLQPLEPFLQGCSSAKV